MNEEVSKEDQDWLDALAGNPPQGMDRVASAQALAVRKALVSRRETIESDVMTRGDNGINEIRARLQREGLMGVPERSQLKNAWWGRAMDSVGFGSGAGGVKAIPIWGVAAMLLIGALLTFQIRGPQTEEALVYRGDPNATTLIVENPELRANEIIAGVNKVAPDAVAMQRLEDGRIGLTIKDSQSAQDYLSTQRIEAVAVAGVIKIEVVPKKK
jgi:hypothetical protein